jgi:hypothetical protein
VLNLVIISGFASATMADPRTGVRCWPALWRPEPRASVPRPASGHPALAMALNLGKAERTSISDFLYHFSSPWSGDVVAGAAYEGRLLYPAVYSH